ncbi:MAG: sulfatase-like hydrolase/transferase [Rikenellaceae bacterium]
MKKEFLLLCSLSAVGATAMAADDARPNIIVILADDLGYADVGFTGAEDILTPNLDKLAESGVTFTQGHCNHGFSAPSRAGLMTGRYQHRFGFETNPAYDRDNPLMGLNPDEMLFPERLQEVGYTTGIIGKWHLGSTNLHHPLNRGFDYFYGFLGGGHDYFVIDNTAILDEAYKEALIRNNKPATFDGYITTAFSDDAVEFINENKENPFFLYLSYNAPHGPLQAPQEEIDRYSQIEDKKRRTYAAMVDVMDRGIGTVVEALKENGLYENTIIFFTSDNGGLCSSQSKNGVAINLPYQGGKGNIYEGGHHVPFLMHWPAKIKEGMEYEYPVIAMDISRTAVAVAGADPNSGYGMDGVDLIPFVTGENKCAPHEALYWRDNESHLVWGILASDGTKLLYDQPNYERELYYLPDDIGETNNIIDRSKKDRTRAEELQQMWDVWNEKNIPSSMPGYLDYHVKLKEFYKSAVPEAAKPYIIKE